MGREGAVATVADREARVLRGVAAGGARFRKVVFTRNRRVMASVGAGQTLRLHEAFAAAPVEVLAAVGGLLGGRGDGRDAARAAVRDYLAASAPTPRPPARRPTRPTPRDRGHLARLQAEFDAVNAEYFAGALPSVPLRISGRMRRRNGHFSANPLEIAISRRLCEQGAAGEAERTLRHEMIHLHQYLSGRKPGHGRDFRAWAERLGITPRATRAVCWSG